MAEKKPRRAQDEGSIYECKDGRWEARYTVETPLGPKRKAVYGRTRKEVVKKLAGLPRKEGVSTDPKLLPKDYLKTWLVEDSVRRPTIATRAS